MQYARAMHMLCMSPRTCHAIHTRHARAMRFQNNMHAPCTCYACALAHAMRYTRATRVLCDYNAICTRHARAMHVPLHVPCDTHVLRTCYAVTKQHARATHVLRGYNAICTSHAHAMYVPSHMPCDIPALRTCYAITMQYARAMHMLCMCPRECHAIHTRRVRAMRFQNNMRAPCTCHACAPAHAM